MRIQPAAAPLPASDDDQPLQPGAKGDAVADAQRKLLRAGYSLPKYGADGDYGSETADAVRRFQKANALPETGHFDIATFYALENAPSPSPEYERLFADHLLCGVIAVGHDEAGAHEPELAKLTEGLGFRGYAEVAADQRAKHGLDPTGRYVTKTMPYGDVVLELIDSNTPNAKARFAEALRKSELVLYGGHGRYGSGPDFDDIDSPSGNFVIGQPYEAGHVTLGPNDLKAAPLTERYQLMFFDGCSTYRYFDDLRAKKGNESLDVIASNSELYWHVTAANLLAMLDGVTEEQNLEQLQDALDAVNRLGPDDQVGYFRGDGFEDNYERPRRQSGTGDCSVPDPELARLIRLCHKEVGRCDARLLVAARSAGGFSALPVSHRTEFRFRPHAVS